MQEGFNIISNTFKHIDGSKADYIYKLVNIGKAKILTENLNIVVIITDKGINVIIGGLETPPSKFFKFTNKLDKEYFENTYNEMVNYLNEVRI